MLSLQPSMHHLAFETGHLRGEGEPGGKALYPRFRPGDLTQCGPH
jgi:hypothetical protein